MTDVNPLARGREETTPAGPRRFRPRLWLSLIALVMLGMLLALGTWQARRYLEASANIAAYRAQHDDQPPLEALDAFPGALDAPERLRALHFRRARLRGTLAPSEVQLLTARYMFGRRGFGVMAPLRLAGPPRPRLLVHLGWVAEDQLAGYLERLQRGGEGVFAGRLQVPPLEPALAPVGAFAGRPTWLRASPAALAARLPALEPRLMLQAGEQARGAPVDPARVPLDGYAHPVRVAPSKHLEYAATWYGLALTLIAVWIALSFRRQEG